MTGTEHAEQHQKATKYTRLSKAGKESEKVSRPPPYASAVSQVHNIIKKRGGGGKCRWVGLKTRKSRKTWGVLTGGKKPLEGGGIEKDQTS